MLRWRGATYFNTVPADGAAYEGENRYHDLNRYRNQLEISVNKLTMAGVRNRSKSQPSPCGIRSAITSPDREVETVMHRQYSSHSCRASPQTGAKLRHSGPPRPATSSADDFRSQVGSRLSGLIQEGPRKSAFSPYKPTTVLTNLQRGNVETQTPVVIPDLSIHQLAAQGELFIDDDTRTYDLELRDENGFTPIMWCCAYGQVPALRTLLKYKVDINACGNRGENALLLASCNGHVEIIRVLLEQNMDVNYADQEGNTALMYAAFNNHAQCAQELLFHKANISLENECGDSAFSIAVNRASKHVQIILERHIHSLLQTSLFQ